MAAAVIAAIDQHIAHAGCAQFAEGDLLRVGYHGGTVPEDTVPLTTGPDQIPGVRSLGTAAKRYTSGFSAPVPVSSDWATFLTAVLAALP